MICKLIQTFSGFKANYQFLINNHTVSYAQIDNNFTFGGTVSFNSFIDKSVYSLCYSPALSLGNVKRNTDEKKYVPYSIMQGENQIGLICRKYAGRGLKKYEYFSVDINGNSFDVFEIGMGKEGIKYPVYSNNLQVALIEKDCEVRNNLDEYNICCADEFSALISYIVSLYIDMMFFAARGQQVSSSFSKTYSKTTNKELKSKYNPAFKFYVNR